MVRQLSHFTVFLKTLSGTFFLLLHGVILVPEVDLSFVIVRVEEERLLQSLIGDIGLPF